MWRDWSKEKVTPVDAEECVTNWAFPLKGLSGSSDEPGFHIVSSFKNDPNEWYSDYLG